MVCLYIFWIARIFLELPKTKKCHYYGNMIGNMTLRSSNMFPTFPMKYFGIVNGHIVYAHEVQGPKMTSIHFL